MVATIACSSAEAHFLEELTRLDAVVASLSARRCTLLRSLAQERQRQISQSAGSRNQASQSALIEIEVLTALRLAETATLSATELFNRAKLTDPKLNPSTFRSVLHRMKAKKFIAPCPGQRSFWTLSPVCLQPVPSASLPEFDTFLGNISRRT